ncbi:MAG: hypothetical protein ACOY99_00650 [Pseudomonadota bacterium]
MAGFSPEVLYRRVADDMLVRFGGNALAVAELAASRLCARQDAQGAAMWHAICAVLNEVAPAALSSKSLH